MRERLYLSVLVGMLLCVAGWTAHAQLSKSGRVTWEYRVKACNQYPPLDDFGAQGWELVAVSAGDCYLKRAK